MTRLTVTTAELLDALVDSAKANAGPDDARTMNELMAEYRIPRDRMRNALRALREEKRLTVHMVVRESLIGVYTKVPAYIITARKRGK